MQNFEFGLNSAPHDEHPFQVCCGAVCLGIKDGSGEGKVPTSPNDSCADTIPGGPPPTGLAAVPALGGRIHSARLTHSRH